ncbi:hypothetical protein ACYEYE_01920, partial [Escherichia coli]
EKRVFLVILFTSFSGSLVSRIPGAVHCQAAMVAVKENQDQPFLHLEREVRKAVKERALEKIKLFGSDGKAE